MKVIKSTLIIIFMLITGIISAPQAHAEDLDITMDVITKENTEDLTGSIMKKIELPKRPGHMPDKNSSRHQDTNKKEGHHMPMEPAEETGQFREHMSEIQEEMRQMHEHMNEVKEEMSEMHDDMDENMEDMHEDMEDVMEGSGGMHEDTEDVMGDGGHM